MKILVTGINGQLGNDVVLELLHRGHDIIGTDVVLPEVWKSNEELRMMNEEWKHHENKDAGLCAASLAEKGSCGARENGQKDFCPQLTANSYPLSLVTLDITDKSAVRSLICGSDIATKKSLSLREQRDAQSPASFSPSSPNASVLSRENHRSVVSGDTAALYKESSSNDTGSCNFVQDDDMKTSQSASQPVRPFDVIIHCAAWTAVEAAEDNAEKCRAVNVEGTRNIAQACAEIGAKMIYISTDYVFSGEGTEPYKPDCRDFVPQNVYGLSKLDGEFAVAGYLEKFFIVRTAWVFGNHGNNFVKTMLKVGATHDEVRVVNDQIGTPTYTPDIAKLLCDMAESDKYGYYHATNEGGFISWYDFTCEIYRQAGYNTKVTPVTTAGYGLSRAKRPANSRLDKSKLEANGFERLPSWKNALERYLAEIKA